MKTPFDTTDLEKEHLLLRHGLQDFEDCVTCKTTLKERQRLKAEVEKVINEVDKETLENGKDVVEELKKRLGI